MSVKKYICEKSYVWNPSTCICENRKYLESIMDDSKINCDKVIKLYNEKIKTSPTIFNEKNITCKIQSFYILLTFLLITITLILCTLFLVKWLNTLKKLMKISV